MVGSSGSSGRGILKSRVGMGRLTVGSERDMPGIVGKSGKSGNSGSGMLKSRVGIGRLKVGNDREIPGIVGRSGSSGSSGRGILKSRVGIGKLNPGRLNAGKWSSLQIMITSLDRLTVPPES